MERLVNKKYSVGRDRPIGIQEEWGAKMANHGIENKCYLVAPPLMRTDPVSQKGSRHIVVLIQIVQFVCPPFFLFYFLIKFIVLEGQSLCYTSHTAPFGHNIYTVCS
jgi:hypothetical protein